MKKGQSGKDSIQKEDLIELNDEEFLVEDTTSFPVLVTTEKYEFEIDDKFQVHYIGKITGVRPVIQGEIETQGFVIEGNNVTIRIIASTTEGEITSIKAPEGATLLQDVSVNEKTYAIAKNGKYVFRATGSNGRTASCKIEVTNIIEKPRINISNDIGTAITVNVENDYPQDSNVTYTYYLDSTEKATNIAEKSYTIDGLTYGKEYAVKVVVTSGGQTLESEVLSIVATKPVTIVTIKKGKLKMSLEGMFKETALEYPMLTLNGIANCSITPQLGDNIKLKLESKATEEATMYYSIDGGNEWKVYTDIVTMKYPGEGKIQAKLVSKANLESDVVVQSNLMCDSEISCTNEWALKGETFDGEYSTYADCDTPNEKAWKIEVDSSCWGRFLTLVIRNESGYGCLSFLNNSLDEIKTGYIHSLAQGAQIRIKNAKSIQIPENSSWVYFFDGTDYRTPNYVYEVWCSEEDLTGTVY